VTSRQVLGGSLLVLVGLLALSLNLRPAAVAVGPVLPEVRAGLHLSATMTGLLTSLPVLAFASFGALAPRLARVAGLHRVTLAGLLLVVGGLAGRVLTDDAWLFLALSMLALAGMATANVLLPSLVKLHFPDRIGPVTALYTTAMSTGLTAALVLTVPVSEAFGGWRTGLGVWAFLALLSAMPWLTLVAHDRRPAQVAAAISLADVARTRLGQAMALTFGLQALQAYVIFGWFAQLWRDAGYSPSAAGVLVGLLTGTAIPLSLWLPAAAARRESQAGLFLAVTGCYLVGYAGLLVAPYTLAVPCAVLVGIGTTAFPLVLTMIGLRTHTPEGTAALSGFCQSTGYLIAAIGPFVVGSLHDATGAWRWPLLLLLGLVVPLMLVGVLVARPRLLEDELAG
jgi:CP family cyanate transporter-like MFS transporter